LGQGVTPVGERIEPAGPATGRQAVDHRRPAGELLFQVFADRYERSSLLLTRNLPLGEGGQVFQGERMTAALLDRRTHHCHIFELTGEGRRVRESVKKSKSARQRRH